MDQHEMLAARFEADRAQLRRLAFRILGSLDDAEDAVQQTWLKLSRADLRGIHNLSAWLTTVTAHECLDVLRARTRRAEVAFPGGGAGDRADLSGRSIQDEVELADQVGRALLVMLDRLTPAERVAIVLHDMFAVPFEQVAEVVDRSPAAAKKLASRARQKVRGSYVRPTPQLRRQWELAAAFLAAARSGDVDGLLAVLAPDVVRRADPSALPAGVAREIRGVDAVIEETVALTRHAQSADVALVDGAAGIVVAARGRLLLALVLTVENDRISAYDVVADAARLDRLSIRLLDQ